MAVSTRNSSSGYCLLESSCNSRVNTTSLINFLEHLLSCPFPLQNLQWFPVDDIRNITVVTREEALLGAMFRFGFHTGAGSNPAVSGLDSQTEGRTRALCKPGNRSGSGCQRMGSPQHGPGSWQLKQRIERDTEVK